MIFEKVRKIICEELDVNEDKVTLETRLTEDLGADSLDAVELIMSLEDEFGVQISNEEAQKIVTVNDIVKCLENLQ